MSRKSIVWAWWLLVFSGSTSRAADLLEVPLRINMGGIKTEDSYGRFWLGDGPGSGDPLNIRPDDAGGANWIEGWNSMPGLTPSVPSSFENLGYDPLHPGDSYIFSTIRWDDAAVAGDFWMEIPIPNGDYQVNMYFNEGCCKNRHFKIMLQGDLVKEDASYLDGDPTLPDPPLGMLWRASFPARVDSELLVVGLLPCPECPGATDQNAIINALEVLAGPACDNLGLDFNCVLQCDTGQLWGAWVGAPGADSYRILKNANILADLPGDARSFIDSSPLQGGTGYSTYTLQALQGGTPVSECRCSVYAYCCPKDLTCTTNVDTKEVVLQWTAPSAGTVSGYEVFRNGALLKTLPAEATIVEDVPATRTTQYEVRPISNVGCQPLLCQATVDTLPFEIPLRINMGGAQTEDSQGNVWLGDGPGAGDPLNIRPDDGGGTNFIEHWNGVGNIQPDSLIALGFDPTHPGDQYIFNTIRWDLGTDGIDFRLQLPVPDGDYKVNLYFNEQCCPGRHFKVEIQGNIVAPDVDMTDYDPLLPGLGVVGRLSFDGFIVTDGFLRLALLPCPECPGATDTNAIINAVEVIPSEFPLKVLRSFSPASYKMGDTVEVGLDIVKRVPDAPVLIKEVLPAAAGLVPGSISDGGIAMAEGIEWDLGGVFDRLKVTYRVTMGDCEGDVEFAGSTWSSGPDVTAAVAGETTLARVVEDTPLGGWTRTGVDVTGDAATALGDHQVLLGGVGAGMRSTADRFSFVHVPATGDFELSTRIDCFAGPDTTAVGLMLRDNLEPDAAFAFFSIGPSTTQAGILRGSFRRESNANRPTSLITISQRDVATLPIYLKIKREGTEIIFERSDDGQAYTEVASRNIGTGTTEINLGESYFAGLTAAPGGPGTSLALLSEVGGPSFKEVVPPEKTFRRGNINGDALVDISDAIGILGYLFLGQAEKVVCVDAADIKDKGAIDISDAISVLNFLFQGGTPPASPGPETCGQDVNQEAPDLGCAQGC